MNLLNRRKFISAGVAGLTGASVLLPEVLRAEASARKMKQIGFQSWIVKEEIGKDLPGTLKKMGALGYNSFELCSPPSYAQSGFGPLQKFSAKELKSMIHDAGFKCISCHYGFSEMKEHAQERIDFAKELGLKQMVISSYGLGDNASLDDWKRAADDTNKIGELTKKSGMPLGYHNHSMEFEKLDGKLIYDVLLDCLDPSLVKMQFQVWVISIGYKAADYFRKYPGRFISAHLYDWSGHGEEMVALGQGVVDWDEFFEAAKTGGVKNYFVEMGEHLKESAEFLKSREAVG